MKVIFLDFDGPIIPLMSHDPSPRGIQEKAWPACVEQLNRVTEQTGAVIVVSSRWRWGGESNVVELLDMWGVKAKVIGITPILEERWTADNPLWQAVIRGDEIQAWLDANEPVESFVILDDAADMGHLASRLVQTPFETGITPEHADKAIAMLMNSCASLQATAAVDTLTLNQRKPLRATVLVQWSR